MCTLKIFCLQTLSVCSVQKTCTRSRPPIPIWRLLLIVWEKGIPTTFDRDCTITAKCTSGFNTALQNAFTPTPTFSLQNTWRRCVRRVNVCLLTRGALSFRQAAMFGIYRSTRLVYLNKQDQLNILSWCKRLHGYQWLFSLGSQPLA